MVKRDFSLSSSDFQVISYQMKSRRFDPSNLIGVAKRCRWGYPQVLLCRPLQKGRPFPTMFWLSCPWLVKACGLQESCGGVGILESFLASRLKEWKAFQLSYSQSRMSLLSHSENRFLRRHRRPLWASLRRGGVGGIDYRSLTKPTVKCLHLQVGAWLGLGYHPGEPWLLENIGPLDCPDKKCLQK